MGKNAHIKWALACIPFWAGRGYYSGTLQGTRSAIMARVWELMDQIYRLIGQRRNRDAQSLLDEVLRIDPQNMDAWDAYMRICQTRHELEWLKKHIRKVWESRVREEDYMQAKQRFILQRVDERMQGL
jgi:hypothetical protein